MTRQQEKKEEKPTNQLGITSQPREKYGIFFFPARFVHKTRKARGETGETRGACRLWVQPMVREELEGKGIWRQIPLTIGSSVRDKQRYDRSEDEKQTEPIIIKSTHRFLCTRQAKIRSKRRRENRRNLSSSSQHIGSSVRDKQRYDRSEDEKQTEPIIIKSTHRFLCTRQAKIRSKRRRENRWNLASSNQHIGSSVRDERRYDQRETSRKEPTPRQSNHLTI